MPQNQSAQVIILTGAGKALQINNKRVFKKMGCTRLIGRLKKKGTFDY